MNPPFKKGIRKLVNNQLIVADKTKIMGIDLTSIST
jgi:hypothetical protein